jgi:hypothetical protein
MRLLQDSSILSTMGTLKYPLPSFLKSELTPYAYSRWVCKKAHTVRDGDCELKRPFAATLSTEDYGSVINEAVIAGRGIDPFTGDTIRFDLLGAYDPVKAHGNRDYIKKFALLPTVDHVDPAADILEFEMCSWKINMCKGNLNPREFVGICEKVIKYKKVDG